MLLPGIPVLPWWVFSLIKAVIAILTWVPFVAVPTMETQVFRFTPSALAELVEAANAHTVSDALHALVWRCIVRARVASGQISDINEMSQLKTAVNMRMRLRPPIPAEFFGNCQSAAGPRMKIADVIAPEKEFPLSKISAAMRDEIVKFTATDAYYRTDIQQLRHCNRILDMQMDLNIFGNDVIGTNWMWFFPNMEALDAGVGEFVRLRLVDQDPGDGNFIVLPAYGCRNGNEEGIYEGGIELRMEMRKSTMDRLKEDEDWKRFATWAEL